MDEVKNLPKTSEIKRSRILMFLFEMFKHFSFSKNNFKVPVIVGELVSVKMRSLIPGRICSASPLPVISSIPRVFRPATRRLPVAFAHLKYFFKIKFS